MILRTRDPKPVHHTYVGRIERLNSSIIRVLDVLVDDLLVIENPLLPLAAAVLHSSKDDLRDLEPGVPKADYHSGLDKQFSRYMQLVFTYRIAFSSDWVWPLLSLMSICERLGFSRRKESGRSTRPSC